MEKNVKQVSNKRLIISSFVVAISIVVIGVSFTYAYFTMRYSGKASVQENKAAIMDVTSTLTNATAINAIPMELIEASEVDTLAKKVEFSVTNEATSNVDVKYIVKLVDFSITKNLFSKYFKWRLVVNPGENQKVINGNFLGDNTAEPGNDTTKLTDLTKDLVSEAEALPLKKSTTDHLVFYIWLENEESVDQLYLTNGSFNAKLQVEAFPTK